MTLLKIQGPSDLGRPPFPIGEPSLDAPGGLTSTVDDERKRSRVGVPVVLHPCASCTSSATCTRLVTPSLARMLETWALTVGTPR